MFTVFTIAVLVILFILWRTMVIIPMREAGILERLGKFKKRLDPGFHVLVPFIDRVAYRHEMREQVLDIPSQSCITRDNVQVEVDGIVYLKVMDPEKASYGIGNYYDASISLAQTTMRSEIGKLDLDDTFSERERINESIVREIDKASGPWGIKFIRYEIRNITPSQHMMDTMEKQMEAERQKRAAITIATGMKESDVLVSEGVKQETINVSEGKRQQRINEATGRAREIQLISDAAAGGITRIADAIQKPGGQAALRMRMIEQFLAEMGKILEKSRLTVVPEGLANIKGFFEGLGRVSAGMAGAVPTDPSVATKNK
ncbi:MAG: paraslipin [Spirochaetes bacterium]|nr:paraslipin [Spirochaetota bacterium]